MSTPAAMTTGYLPGLEGAELRRDLSQFYTPRDLAERLWAWTCKGGPTRSVLEPSAGRGALLRPLLAEPGPRTVYACEADPLNVAALQALNPGACTLAVIAGDFLQVKPIRVDVSVQNTPFEDGQDIGFVEVASLWAPRVCGIFPASMFYSESRALFWSRFEPTRIVHLTDRPRFGGDYSPQTNFMLLELRKRTQAVATPTVEFW